MGPCPLDLNPSVLSGRHGLVSVHFHPSTVLQLLLWFRPVFTNEMMLEEVLQSERDHRYRDEEIPTMLHEA